MKIADSIPKIDGVLARTDLQASARENAVLWRFPPERLEAERGATPWWLWWNILSIDAPAVAVVWAALFAHASGIRLPVAEAAALALSVWIIYTSDRLLDGWTAGYRAALRERHLFCERHRFVLTGLAVTASALVLWLMVDGSLAAETIAGVKLGVILMLYMAGIHAGRGRIARVLPKEISVGFLFALGTTLPVWSRRADFPWHECLVWGLFGLLCSLNCLSIECWENHRPESRLQRAGWKQPPHPFVRWAAPRIPLIAGVLAAGGLAAGLAPSLARGANWASQPALFAVVAGALSILLLNCVRTKVSSAALRVLADAALLAPAVVALLIRG